MKSTLYYYHTDSEINYNFIRTPKIVFSSPKLKNLSSTAKLLYIKLFDLLSLSIKNNWTDKQNRVYVHYTVKNAMEDLGCCYEKILKTFSELDVKTGAGLIERKRTAFGKPLMIYVYNPDVVCSDDKKEKNPNTDAEYSEHKSPEQIEKHNICRTDVCTTDNTETHMDKTDMNSQKTPTSDIGLLPSVNVGTAYTNNIINNNNSNKNNINKNSADFWITEMKKRQEYKETYRMILKHNIDYNNLINEIPAEKVNRIINLMLTQLCSSKILFEFDEEIISYDKMKERFMTITKDNIMYVHNYNLKNDFPDNDSDKKILDLLHRSFEP